jgi:hypothetical protein
MSGQNDERPGRQPWRWSSGVQGKTGIAVRESLEERSPWAKAHKSEDGSIAREGRCSGSGAGEGVMINLVVGSTDKHLDNSQGKVGRRV